MFPFNKSRVYRSVDGCCICRAKSSSSRFTDADKYEEDSLRCFNLKAPRHGEICNACVLLVKRYKRLPPGSSRNWAHVVDARGGSGFKSLTKARRFRDENHEMGGQERSNCASSSAAKDSSTKVKTRKTSANNNSNSNNNNNNIIKPLIPEKFSKIFKKTRKNKAPASNATATPTQKKENIGKRKSAAAAHRAWTELSGGSLPTTPESLDSDYEDERAIMPPPPPSTNSAAAGAATGVQFQTQTRASAHRSRSNSSSLGGVSVQRKATASLKSGSGRRRSLPPRKNRRVSDNVSFFDAAEWQQRNSCCGTVFECASLGGAFLVDLETFKPCPTHRKLAAPAPPKAVIATMPAVVQLVTPSAAAASVAAPPPCVAGHATSVLKKHHLFFKRQSECFPKGDIVCPIPAASTVAVHAACPSSAPTLPPVMPAYKPRHSTAKMATILPSVLHKTKPDVGKIVKNSAERLSATAGTTTAAAVAAAACLKAQDMAEVKDLIRPVEKAFLMAKPIGAPSGHTYSNGGYQLHPPQSINAAPSHTHNTVATSLVISPNASTKYNDNSSDSGFDENMQERKSASPSQEDTEKKLMTRTAILQAMFVNSGIKFKGQQQNLQLAGSEMAAKLPTPVKRKDPVKDILSRNTRGGSKATHDGAAQHPKMRAIYHSNNNNGNNSNNNNTIKHENGVTTIVPASSLAATTQTAAMHAAALAPSTLTITPALQLPQQQQQQRMPSMAHKGAMNSLCPGVMGAHLGGIPNGPGLNQKVFVLKTTPNATTTAPPTTKYAANIHGGSAPNAILNNVKGGLCKN